MDTTPEKRDVSENQRGPLDWADTTTLTTVAFCLVIAAAGWFLLRELATLLRPLLLAVFLCYVILPVHLRLKGRLPGPVAVVVLAAACVGILFLLALLVYESVLEFNEELPQFIQRGQQIIEQARRFSHEHLPAWLPRETGDAATTERDVVGKLQAGAAKLVAVAADVVTEAILVGIYLLFLLLEARRMPRRIEGSFTTDRAEQILAVVKTINEAMASYLLVKVKASLVLAVPATVILWAFGVKFALLWGLLTFFLNFIPYLGSIVACSLPILLAFLQLPLGWQPVAVAVLLVADHSLSAYLIEPAMTGKAVGLSPLVILVSLSFWGLCWGPIGMFLAIPLTVMLKIVLENVAFTRPAAKLLGDG